MTERRPHSELVMANPHITTQLVETFVVELGDGVRLDFQRGEGCSMSLRFPRAIPAGTTVSLTNDKCQAIRLAISTKVGANGAGP